MVNTNLKYIPFSHDLRACLHLNHDDMHYSIQEPKSKETVIVVMAAEIKILPSSPLPLLPKKW